MTGEHLARQRSILFVPADKPELAPKAAKSAADVVCLDLEDGVAQPRKQQARAALEGAAQTLRAAGKTVWIRVNSELEEFARDVAELPATCAAIVVPKARDLTHIALVGETLDRMDARRAGDVSIVALVEDPAAIAAFEDQAHRRPHHRLKALAFGVEDLAMEMGVQTMSAAVEYQFQKLVSASSVLQIPLLGYPGTISDFRDLDAFETRVRIGRDSGAAGGFCIHPAQVEALNRVFTPSDAELDWARKVAQAFETAQNNARGVAVVDGAMVDLPVYQRALRILAT